ncbi:restriction endonuclease subunit S [Sorangium sp. So ce429]
MLRSPSTRRHFSAHAGGTSGSMQNISQSDIKSAPLLLPPLAEQQRIAAILDKADEIRRNRTAAIDITQELLRAVFLETFGDPAANPKGWPIVKIGQIAEVATGGTPSRSDESNYNGWIPWVKTTEVRNNIIYTTEESISDRGLNSSNCRTFPTSSLIVAMYGQGLTRGRTAKLGINAATNQACAVILPSDAYGTEYLWTLLRLSYDRLRHLGRGGNQPNLNLGMIRSFEIPLPPIDKQREFESVAKQIESMAERHRHFEAESNILFASLTQRIFHGHL